MWKLLFGTDNISVTQDGESLECKIILIVDILSYLLKHGSNSK